MPIDPTISLNAKVPEAANPLDVANKVMSLQNMQQQISASQTQQQATQAQIPGMQADSEIKQRAAAFNKWKIQHASEFMDDGPAGSAPQFNRAKFVGLASQAGFVNEAQAVAANDLSNSAAQIKNADDANTFLSKARGYAGQLTANAPVDQRPALWNQYSQYIDGLMPGAAQQLGGYDAGKAGAFRSATMTPLEQENLGVAKGNLAVSQGNLAVSQESQRQAGVVNAAGPDYRDPNSSVSQQARKAAADAGINVAPNATAADLAHIPQVSAIIGASVVPAGTKAAGVAGAVDATQKANSYGALLDPLNKLKESGKLPHGTSVGSWIDANAARFGNDPNFRALQAAAASMPELDLQHTDVDGLVAQVKQLQSTAKTQAGTAGSVAGAQTFNQTPGQTVRVVNTKTGKTGMIPANRLAEYLANGYKTVGN